MLSPAFGSAENAVDAIQEKRRLHQSEHRDDKVLNGGGSINRGDVSSKTSHAAPDDQEQQRSLSDRQLVDEAEAHHSDDRLLAAARLLQTVQDPSLLQPHHRDILRLAADCTDFVSSLKSSVDDTDSTWTKQGESHGKHDTVIYYKMGGENRTNLTARMETPIPHSLLVPLLSVLNETELYRTWLPSWDKPRLGVTSSDKLDQSGRVSQTISVVADMPWPLAAREVVIGATGFDDIDASGDIAVRLKGVPAGGDGGGVDGGTRCGEAGGGGSVPVPPPKGGAVRVDFDGGFLFRQCPPDHPAFDQKSTSSRKVDKTADDPTCTAEEEPREDLILASFAMYVDAKIGFLPNSVINFVVRTVIGRMWEMFLSVAEDVRDGRRPRHGEAIAAKRACLYDWVDERVGAMLGQMGSDDYEEDIKEDAVANSSAYLSYIQC